MGDEISVVNVEWRRPQSAAANRIRERIWSCSPDVVCLTEANLDMLEGGHVIAAAADYRYGEKASRRGAPLEPSPLD